MGWQHTPYTWPLVVTAALSVALATFTWRRRPTTGGLLAGALMFAVGAWAMTYALELASVSLAAKVLWAKLQYVAVVTSTTLWLIVALEYTGRGAALKSRYLALLAVEPIFIVALVFTNEAHGLVWPRITLERVGDFLTIVVEHGPAFWLHLVYSYLLLLAGTLLLLQVLLRSFHLYRWQATALLVAIVAPWLGNILYVTRLNPFPGLDPTPFAFAITSVGMTWSVFRLRLRDIVPIARKYVMESMGDGVIVLDPHDRVMDANPGAARAVGRPLAALVGCDMRDIVPDWARIAPTVSETEEVHREIALAGAPSPRIYDLTISPLLDWRQRCVGRVLVLHDITTRRQMEEENQRLLVAERHQRLLAETLREVTLALTSHTSHEAVLDEVLRQARRLVPCDSASIMLVENDVLRIARWHGYERFGADEFIRDLTQSLATLPFSADVVNMARPAAVPDTHQDARWFTFPETAWIRSHAAIPITLHGKVLGLLRLDSSEPNRLSQADAERLQPLADAAAIALENARLHEQARQEIAERKRTEKTLRRQVQELTVLHKVATASVEAPDEDDLIQRVTTIIGETFFPTNFGVLLCDDTTGALRVHPSYRLPPGATHRVIPPGQGITTRVAMDGIPRRIPDVRSEPTYLEVDPHTRSELCVPIRLGEKVIGVINAESAEVDAFSTSDQRLLTILAGQLATAIQSIRLHQATRRQAQELATLLKVASAISSTLNLEEVLQIIAREITEALGVFGCAISRWDREADAVVTWVEWSSDGPAGVDPPGTAYSLAEFPATRDVLERRQPLAVYVNDPDADPAEAALLRHYGLGGLLMLPLAKGDNVIGLVEIGQADKHRHFTPRETQFCEALVAQAAVAIENARLYEETRRRARQLEVLRDVLQTLNATPDITEIFPALVSRLRHITGCDRVSLVLINEKENTFSVIAVDQPRPELTIGTRMSLDDTAAAADVLAGRVHLTPDLAEDAAEYTVDRALYNAGYRSRINVPLLGIDDKVIGALNLVWPEPRGYDIEFLPLLQQTANAIALAMERSRLFQESQRQTRELVSLYETALTVSSALDTGTLLDRLYEQVRHLMPLDGFGVFLYRPEQEEIEVVMAMEHQRPVARVLGGRIPLEEAGLTGWVIRNRRSLLVPDLATATLPAKPRHVTQPSRSWLGVPLVARDRLIGAITVQTFQPDAFHEGDRRFLESLAAQVAIAIENARLFEETRHMLDQMREQALRVQRIIDTVPEAVLLLDSDQRVVVANPAGHECLRLVGEVAVGDVITHLGDVAVKNLLEPRPGQLWTEIVLAGSPSRVFEAVARPMGTGEQPEGWVLVLRDVTQEREVQARVQQQERLAAVGQLAAGIAHDFNNILQGIIGFADLLAKRQDMPQPYRERLHMIADQGRRGARLVRQILDFSRRSITDKHPLNLHVLTAEVVRLLEHTLPESVHISLTVDPGEYWMLADPAQMQQVLTNLATNARDAMPEGGRFEVHLSPLVLSPADTPPLPEMTPGRWSILSVSDTGVGIPPEVLPHIFEPFFTTKEVGKGTGLGLAQVYGIVRQHDGYIHVTSHPGHGTTFTIYLPALLEPQRTGGQPAPSSASSARRGVVLLVEDDPRVLESTRYMLEEIGYAVLSSSDGSHALGLFEEKREEVAVIVTDMVMPGMTGLALAQALRQRGHTVPVVVMTGYPVAEGVRTSPSPDIAAWLRKPFSQEQLAQAISKARDSTQGQ